MTEDFTDISTEEEMISENCDSGVSLSREMDELLNALDAIGDRANDSMQAAADSELLWLQTLQERDELILTNNESLKNLQKINDQLREENDNLKEQVECMSETLTDSNLADSKGKPFPATPRSTELASKLTSLTQASSDLIKHIQEQHRNHKNSINSLKSDLRHDIESEPKLRNLIDTYDSLINEIHQESENFGSIFCEGETSARWELNGVHSQSRNHFRSSSAPTNRKMLGSDDDLFRVKNLERINSQLRGEVTNLQKELNAKEQRKFKSAMKRFDSKNQEQLDKMRLQLVEMSQELTHMSVDNRALRESLLKVEGEKETKTASESNWHILEKESKQLQANLKQQLLLHAAKDDQIQQLELLRKEHQTVCRSIKAELADANIKIAGSSSTFSLVEEKLRDSEEIRKQVEEKSGRLNEQMQFLQAENKTLQNRVEVLQKKQKVESSSLLSNSSLRSDMSANDGSRKELAGTVEELTSKLNAAEKHRENSNKKVQALRERLKGMHDSWEKISSDTEASYTSLRQQYQQQIDEYKTIIESLKTQNSSLHTRIDSLTKVKSVSEQFGTIDKMTTLENQLAEAQKVSDDQKVQNLMLKKELRSLHSSREADDAHTSTKTESSFVLPDSDEFGKLRDILNAAKSDVQTMQLKQSPKSPFKAPKERSHSPEDNLKLNLKPPTYTSTPMKSSPEKLLARQPYKYQPLLERKFEPLARSSPMPPESKVQTTIKEIRLQNRKEQILINARAKTDALSWRPRNFGSHSAPSSGTRHAESPSKKVVSRERISPNKEPSNNSQLAELKKQIVEVTTGNHRPELDPSKTFKPIQPEYSPSPPIKPKSAVEIPTRLTKYEPLQPIRLATADSAYESMQSKQSHLYTSAATGTAAYSSKYYTPSKSRYSSEHAKQAGLTSPLRAHTSPDYKSKSSLEGHHIRSHPVVPPLNLKSLSSSGAYQQQSYRSRFVDQFASSGYSAMYKPSYPGTSGRLHT